MLTRSFNISVILLVIISIICTQIPLLNYLGFEYSFTIALFLGFISGFLTLSLFKKYTFSTKYDIWRFVVKVYSLLLILSLIPLLVSLANSFFVKNCSIKDGLFLYILIVIPAALFTSALAVIIAVSFGKWHKVIYAALFFLILAHIPIIIFFKPQIFAFNLIVGIFPGLTYDETLQVIRTLSIFRVLTLVVTALLLTIAIWIWDFGFKKISTGKFSIPLTETALIACFLPIILVSILFSERFGLSSSESYIRQKLFGNYKTRHFEIIFPAGIIKKEKIEMVGNLSEFYLHELNKELALNNLENIKIFIYSSSEQKRKYIGTGTTAIAKPWLRQIHINYSDIEFGLKHEIAHVIASEFGWSLLKIGRNLGIIEGLATALEYGGLLDTVLHRNASMIFAINAQPNRITSLFSFIGFAKLNPDIAYNLAGSFCRFLIDKRGVSLFKKYYYTGNFEEVYNQSFSSFVNEWEQYLGKVRLSQEDIIRARYFYSRPSIFTKECARVIAELNSEVKNLYSQSEFEKALELAEKSLALSRSSMAIFFKSASLFELQRYEDVITFCKSQLSDSSINFLLLPLFLRMGDSYWAMDSIEEAKRQFSFLNSIHLNEWYDEECVLRLECLKNFNLQQELKRFFIYSLEDSLRVNYLGRIQHPVAHYLIAKEYEKKGLYWESINELNSIASLELLEYFRLKKIGLLYYELNLYDIAREYFLKASKIAPYFSYKLRMEELVNQCEFNKIENF